MKLDDKRLADTKPPNLMTTMDANDWAAEFMRCWGHRRDGIDFDLMLSWFAAAIMCGHDHTRWKREGEDE